MDKTFLNKAIQLAAEKSRDGTSGPFGAVIVKDGDIVGEGWNQVTEMCDPSAHAEIMAIRQAGKKLCTHDLGGCELYASCEPCPMCLSAIYWARIDRVYYACCASDAADAGFDDEMIRRELLLPPSERGLRTAQECREQGLAVFRQWIQNPDKRTY